MSCDCKNNTFVIDGDKIEYMEKELFIELKVDAYLWKTLFRCRYCNVFWKERFKDDRFIGNPQLLKVDNDYVTKEWGQEFTDIL